jgi:small-conductance mechanosensitive channel
MQEANASWHYVSDPVMALGARFAALAPNLLGALLLLVAGYILGKICAWLVRRILGRMGFDRLAEGTGLSGFLSQAGIKRTPSSLAGAIVFAFLFLAFALSAADALGLATASEAVTRILLFLPKLAAALVLLVLGLMVAKWLATGVRNLAENGGIEYAATLERITMGVLAAIVILLVVDQLGVQLLLLHELISVLVFAIGIALALSLGLGTRSLSGEIVSGVYLRDLVKEGDRIAWGETQGRLVEVGTIKSTLRLEDGRLLTIANSRLIAEAFTVERH